MSEEVKIEVWVRTDMVGSKVTKTITFNKEDWDRWTLYDREEACYESVQEMIEWDYIDGEE